jgi:probable HAF family extracellular repeat protein
MTELPTAGSMNTYGYGINDNGSVVGSLEGVHGFLYANGITSDLGTLGGQCHAFGVNNANQVVGESEISVDGDFHAFVYSAGTMHDLGTLGGPLSQAYGINNLGQIVGTAQDGPDTYRAFLYAGGVMTPIGVPGRPTAAWEINDHGQITCTSPVNSGTGEHAFLYSNGSLHDLGTFGGDYSYPDGINNNGQVVGYATVPDNTANHAFLYSGGTLFDLNSLVNTNSLGTYLTEAKGINDSGQIIAFGWNSHSYLLTPVPEPSIMAFLTPLALLLVKRRPSR